MKDEAKLVKALDAIDGLKLPKAASAVPYCREYCLARPHIPVLLKALKLIPLIGPRAAKLIEILMPIADSVCQCGKK